VAQRGSVQSVASAAIVIVASLATRYASLMRLP
jgi:hypothetical protein